MGLWVLGFLFVKWGNKYFLGGFVVEDEGIVYCIWLEWVFYG